MKLKRVQIQKYQNIVNSDEVEIDDKITCLVGKNESGKTAFLQALHKLNPHYPIEFKALEQYPRWRYKLDERRGDINSDPVVRAIFELEASELECLDENFGAGTLKSNLLVVSKYYDNEIIYELDIDELKILRDKLLLLPEDSDLRKAMNQKKTLESFQKGWGEAWNEIQEPTEEEKELNSLVESGLSQEIEALLSQFLPTIFYFDEYSSLPGRIKLEDFLNKPSEELSGQERTADALLDLAGTDRESIKTDEFEDRIAELEASASLITQTVLEYWTQNDHISVDFKVDKDIERHPNGNHTIRAHYLDIRLRDLIHDVTINFDRRSSGFKWFFSFLIAFSEFEHSDIPIIILLDEPGLNLHAKAQNDFLRFIKEKLSVDHQVIYTTHSPFMVEPKNLHQVRLVEDVTTIKNKVGSKITSDIFSTNYDTIFPLQNALGYDIAQNLFVGKQNLIVEGTSDFVYFNILSRHLESKNREHLDFTKITITPVGGASKVATFVALLGQHLDATVFVDAVKNGNQRINDLISRGLLQNDKYLTPADFLNGKVEADIEDLFQSEDYLRLYNDAFNEQLKPSDLKGKDPIVRRIARTREDFDHGKPAEVLLRNTDRYLNSISDDTLDRFEAVFQKINQTLG